MNGACASKKRGQKQKPYLLHAFILRLNLCFEAQLRNPEKKCKQRDGNGFQIDSDFQISIYPKGTYYWLLFFKGEKSFFFLDEEGLEDSP